MHDRMDTSGADRMDTYDHEVKGSVVKELNTTLDINNKSVDTGVQNNLCTKFNTTTQNNGSENVNNQIKVGYKS